MELRAKILDHIESFFEKQSSSIESVSFFLQNIRLLLEIDNLKENYKIVNHYCNWIFHKDLDKGLSSSIIKEIVNSFENAQSKNDCIKRINLALSVKKLILEFKELLNKNIGFKHDGFIENDGFWIKFITILCNEIKFRPILFTLKHKKQDQEISCFDFSIYGIQLNHNKNKIVIEVLSTELENQNKKFYIDFTIFR